MIKNMALDDVDAALLQALQEDARQSNADLARRVNLSAPAVHARVKRLEAQGIIRRYTAIVDREKAGYDLLCFIHINIQLHQPEQVQRLKDALKAMPEVLECHHITGEHDLLLKVALRNRKDMEQFVVERLTPVPGIARIQTSLVLAEIKETNSLALT